MRNLFITTLLLASLGACQNSKNSSNSTNDQNSTSMDNQEKSAIAKTLTSYFSALNASDVQTAVGAYSKDGVFMPTKFPTAKGTEQLVKAYENVFKTIQLKVTFKIEETIVRDNMAFVSTLSNGTTLIHANGQIVPEENREFFLMKKEGGEWKIARYMFNQPK